MPSDVPELAQVRLANALALFDEFVRATAKHADATTLRGLERRFAERVQIQPSYWSQIKGRSRQIGERLARQFEQLCHKRRGWMDVAEHNAAVDWTSSPVEEGLQTPGPHDDDERFIVGLVLTYYRRHPQRARARLLELLGEVLMPAVPGPAAAARASATPLTGSRLQSADEAHALWLRSQAGVAPLKRKK